MTTTDWITALHPAIAIFFIFPLIGMVINFAWKTRQRRQQGIKGRTSKIPPNVGSEHLNLGRWLSVSVVGIALLGMAQPIVKKMVLTGKWMQEPVRAAWIVLTLVITITALILLCKTRLRFWRGLFATLTGMRLILLGSQPEIYRRDLEWYFSHYYYGLAAALLMIFSLAIVPDIYQDRSHRWRTVHVVLNCLALLLFVGQGVTGARDLLEIPLSWQSPYIEQLYSQNCQPPAPTNACRIQETTRSPSGNSNNLTHKGI